MKLRRNSPSIRIFCKGFWVLVLLVMASSPMARAAEFGTGVYVLGYQSSMAGYMPDPGFYLRNDFYVYQGNAKIMPFARRVEADLRSRWISDLIAGVRKPALRPILVEAAGKLITQDQVMRWKGKRIKIRSGGQRLMEAIAHPGSTPGRAVGS